MPSRNRVKDYGAGVYYHLYNRGNNKDVIFQDSQDYAVFLNLIKRHLSPVETTDKLGRPYRNLSKEVELLAFCLMPNHYHLLIYQHTQEGMTQLLRSVATAYSGYYNKKYQRVGRLFQDAFKASAVDSDTYLEHISRYIHLNPKDWKTWEWSSLPYYLHQKTADWVKHEEISGMINAGM
ncbi:transposase [Candidatus Nomurabacteria bacterium]|nr:transposase [Candidatus Nomurabacteria bacterium]